MFKVKVNGQLVDVPKATQQELVKATANRLVDSYGVSGALVYARKCIVSATSPTRADFMVDVCRYLERGIYGKRKAV